MKNKEKARKIAEYLNQPNGSNSLLECFQAAMAMAEWKDSVFKGFLFELALLLCSPKTDFEKSIRHAFPMSGLDTIDSVVDFLYAKQLEYEKNGTILTQIKKVEE